MNIANCEEAALEIHIIRSLNIHTYPRWKNPWNFICGY